MANPKVIVNSKLIILAKNSVMEKAAQVGAAFRDEVFVDRTFRQIERGSVKILTTSSSLK